MGLHVTEYGERIASPHDCRFPGAVGGGASASTACRFAGCQQPRRPGADGMSGIRSPERPPTCPHHRREGSREGSLQTTAVKRRIRRVRAGLYTLAQEPGRGGEDEIRHRRACTAWMGQHPNQPPEVVGYVQQKPSAVPPRLVLDPEGERRDAGPTTTAVSRSVAALPPRRQVLRDPPPRRLRLPRRRLRLPRPGRPPDRFSPRPMPSIG